MPEPMTRDEHPLRLLADAHVTQLRAERAEERLIAATESSMETIAEACITARHVLGPEAANALTWDVTPPARSAFADVGGGLFLEYSPHRTSFMGDNGAPGFLSLVRQCSGCGSRQSEPVASLEKLAFLFEDIPTKAFDPGSGE